MTSVIVSREKCLRYDDADPVPVVPLSTNQIARTPPAAAMDCDDSFTLSLDAHMDTPGGNAPLDPALSDPSLDCDALPALIEHDAALLYDGSLYPTLPSTTAASFKQQQQHPPDHHHRLEEDRKPVTSMTPSSPPFRLTQRATDTAGSGGLIGGYNDATNQQQQQQQKYVNIATYDTSYPSTSSKVPPMSSHVLF